MENLHLQKGTVKYMYIREIFISWKKKSCTNLSAVYIMIHIHVSAAKEIIAQILSYIICTLKTKNKHRFRWNIWTKVKHPVMTNRKEIDTMFPVY